MKKQKKIEKVHVLCSYCRERLHENFIEGDNGNLYCCTECEENSIVNGNHNTDGSKTSYYDIDVSGIDTIDINWLARELSLTFFQGNALKALFGVSRGSNARHKGTSSIRDAKKLHYYSSLILEMEEKEDA